MAENLHLGRIAYQIRGISPDGLHVATQKRRHLRSRSRKGYLRQLNVVHLFKLQRGHVMAGKLAGHSDRDFTGIGPGIFDELLQRVDLGFFLDDQSNRASIQRAPSGFRSSVLKAASFWLNG